MQKLSNYSTGKFLKVYTGRVNSVYCITSTFSVTNVKYKVKKCDHQQNIRVHDDRSDFVISVTWVRIALLLQALIMI